jgi:peptide/nickel transport system permease protein
VVGVDGAVTGQLLRRLATMLLTVWLVATLTFVVVQAVPGSYADAIDHPRMTPTMRDAVRARWGLDRPVHEQYLRWLGAIVSGDLGVSYVTRQPVTETLARALPPTLLLAGTALVLDLVLGLILAVAAARRPHGRLDRALTVFGLGLYGLPSFWVAGLVVLVFAVGLGWFPPSHMYSIGAERLGATARVADLVHHLVLPACCLGFVGAAGTARYLRASLLDLRGARFLTALRARGVPERRIAWIHALRPALAPVVTLLGLSLPFLVGGSVVIETIFSWPGMGSVLLTAAQARDVPVIMAITVIGAVGVVVGNLVADLAYAAVDPRARDES